MAKNMVKCPYCNKEFDKNSEEFVAIGRRYAHKGCYDAAGGASPFKGDTKKQKTSAPADPIRKEIMDYISVVYGASANHPMINKQLKRFTEELHFSMTGILNTLKYIFEVKRMTTEKSNGGIGLVEYMYQPARDYYYKIWLAQQNNENKTFITQIKEFIIKPTKIRGTKNKTLEWEFDDEEE